MQKIQYLLAITLLLTSSMFVSCDDNSNSPGTSTPASGEWKVTYFFDKKVETSIFSGFVFGSNGSLSATQNGQTWSGTWSTGFDDSKNKLLITFSGGAPSSLVELQEDWLIIKMDDNLIHLEHTSGGNGDTDVIHFERI